MRKLVVGALTVVLGGLGPSVLEATQLPLAPTSASGATVTPAFEGWYENHDGTYSLSFGYYSRNSESAVEIPIGQNNFIEPGDANQGQPVRFEANRHWGVFVVEVPATFGDGDVVWTLKNHGETFSIPGHLHPDWRIDALDGEAGSGNTPPVLTFDMGGPEGRGPAGIVAGPLSASLDAPLSITVWTRDDGATSGSVRRTGEDAVPVTLTWFKHQGPGAVRFSDTELKVPAAGGQATTTATFSEPGEYILRVRANDASGVSGAGHAQCCWTNGFLKVTVINR